MHPVYQTSSLFSCHGNSYPSLSLFFFWFLPAHFAQRDCSTDRKTQTFPVYLRFITFALTCHLTTARVEKSNLHLNDRWNDETAAGRTKTSSYGSTIAEVNFAETEWNTSASSADIVLKNSTAEPSSPETAAACSIASGERVCTVSENCD